MGSKRSWVHSWPDVPNVWPVLIGTKLTREEILCLEEAGFCLQQRPGFSPRRLFSHLRGFEPVQFDHPGVAQPELFPTTRNGKKIRRAPKVPSTDQRNKWESARNVQGTIIDVTVLPHPGFGTIISLQSGAEPNHNVYRITLSNYPECTCLDFKTMAVASIGKRGQYMNCKHLYYIYRFICKADVQKDSFVHAPSLSFNEVKHLLLASGIMRSTPMIE
jgi:hypothetical protein